MDDIQWYQFEFRGSEKAFGAFIDVFLCCTWQISPRETVHYLKCQVITRTFVFKLICENSTSMSAQWYNRILKINLSVTHTLNNNCNPSI